MPLVQIEVCDFKSYRGHQTIGPFRNFTSVIGPNGAGKSNLMDAISFVLGVKSAQLRSSQLKDLVYRGRRLGKDPDDTQDGPDAEDEEEEEGQGEGTAKKAWVLALFEDANKKEWRFQRTISTTGSSEYKLNNRVVTYSAYNAALTQHNILVKAKNFLVFQGDVEAVASQSPRELTRLIEQISGSLELQTEYEKAKEEQDKATENATFNFTKRRGIQGEIKQYKEQKSEADRFEGMTQERDALILRRMLFKLFHIEEAIESHVLEIREQTKQLAGLREDQKNHEDALKAARAEQAQARSGVLGMENRIKRSEKALDNKRPELITLEAQVSHSTRKLNNATKTRDELVKSTEAQQAKLDGLKKELEKVKAAADAAQEKQRKASEQNLSLSAESLEEYHKLKTSASLHAVDARQSLETLSRNEKSTSRSLALLKEKQKGLEEKRALRAEDDKGQTEKKKELETKIATLQEELAGVKQELDNHQSERTRISQLEKQANEQLATVYQQLLQAGVDKNESEREMKLKEVIASLQRVFTGVRGRVVELCQPTQRKYETAVSVVLGRNTDSIVVDEEKTAIECIEYLRTQRAGSATFIPLDTISVKPIHDKYRSYAKGARLAVDVIQYDAALERAIHHACGNALVCDTMEVAKYVCYEKGQGQEVKAVTLDGTIIHKSGLITGGRSTHDAGRKWDEKDVQGLARTRDSLLSKLRELNKQKPRGKNDDNLISDIHRIENALTIARDELNACKLRLTGIKDELKHLDKEIKNNSPELKKTSATHDSLRSEITKLERTVHAAEDRIFANFCQSIGVENIREYEERQLKVAQAEREARLKFDNQIARLTHQTEFETEAVTGTQDRIKQLDKVRQTEEAALSKLGQDKEARQKEITDAESSLGELKEQLVGLQETLEEKTRAVDQVKKTSGKAVKALDACLKEIASRNDSIEKCSLERSSLYRKCRLEDIPLPLAEGNLKNVPMEENLREEVAMDIDEDENRPINRGQEYGIEVNFDSLDDEEREDGSPEALAQFDSDITKLAAEIEKMAPNMKAVERLEDVENKLARADEEADDARKDSKGARDRFAKVKKQRCDLFNKAYDHISGRIDQVYKDLTKGKAAPMGGVAYLALEDNEEPYLAGIKYHAMPPMKRFRDMEQLSGGEKTVAALALLFAIHSFQPAPFFVLDEVDAALDNTNVAKVANYIRAHASEAFQFIVISLKGSLYERGNSLVGIFRDQDVNSSRTLTLDLNQYDD